MADSRTRVLRLFVGLALVMAALAEAQTLLLSFRAEGRLRERTRSAVCSRLESAWPDLRDDLQTGAGDRYVRVAERLREAGLAREVEVFDLSGAALVSYPSPAPVGHSPDAATRRQILDGKLHCEVVSDSGAVRVFAYAAIPPGNPTHLLRLAADEPDLTEDAAERSRSVLVHQMAMGLLVAAGLLSLWPARSNTEAPASALGAYERAMESLRQRDEDLRDRHAAERDRLAEALRHREAFSRAGEILAGIVHEVRNGLGTILGYARILERTDAEASEKGRLIRAECESLDRIVRRFVELVRDERPNLAPFEIGRLLQKVAEREAGTRGVPPPVHVAAGLPPIVGDEALLERAFENLVRNALEAATAQGVVEISVTPDAEALVVAVSDDGPGLPEGSEPAVLLTTKPGGLGLGLSLARKIVSLHQGSLTLLPRRPRGVEAVVVLPSGGPSPNGGEEVRGGRYEG